MTEETRAKISAAMRGRKLSDEHRAALTTHAMIHAPEYVAWQSMNRRCHSPSAATLHPHYAGRGIIVADEWRHDFLAFYTHIGARPGPGYSLDRINNDGNYEPGNVRWSTAREQRANQRPRSKARS